MIGKEKCEALLCFHAFTTAYWGGKFASICKKSWNKTFLSLEKSDEIVSVWAFLGTQYQKPSDNICCLLEKFVCITYALKSAETSLKGLRWELFRLKSKEGEKLPHTRSSFLPHLWRPNNMAHMWKLSKHLQMELPSPVSYGWNKKYVLDPVMSLQS